MKAYKFTVLVIDFENMGIDEAKQNLENAEYVRPHILEEATADIGEWNDDHPLNYHDKINAEAARLFGDK